MSKKQKRILLRILIAGGIFAVLFVLEQVGALGALPAALWFILYAIPYVVIGYDVIYRAFRNIRNGQVFDENFLMMIATFAAFAIREYSESVAVMLFYQVGELFQSYAVGKSRQSIAQMMSIVPEYANLKTENGYDEVDPEDVLVGSLIIIRPGERVPLDGVIEEGSSFLDTAALTGESIPRRVGVGDEVFSGCVNQDTALIVRVTKAYEDSTVSRILELVEDASSRKANLENFITRFAKYYTPIVTFCALALAILPPLLFGENLGAWIERACIFLIVSCPCALVISVPLGFFGGIGAASRIGVLVKGGNFLEATSYMSSLVFDKTGTITKGIFSVTDVLPEAEVSSLDVLRVAAHAEGYSLHPIADSIRKAYEKPLQMEDVSDVTEDAGYGITCTLHQKQVAVGNTKLMEREGIAYKKIKDVGTVIYVALDQKLLGTIIISDEIKEDAVSAIDELKKNGIRQFVMLTGDREETAKEIAQKIGMTEYYAQLLPTDKVSYLEEIISRSAANKKVGFVGDGINDAPVLMRADVGIAMGSMGSDAAIEAADIVLMDDDIKKISSLVKISRKTLRIVKQNITFALGVKILVLILGALGLTSMWVAVFADVGVAVIAILNSMRTLRA